MFTSEGGEDIHHLNSKYNEREKPLKTLDPNTIDIFYTLQNNTN